MCGVDSPSFPPTITKLIYNILSNHLILFPPPVSEVYLFTFPRKGSPFYSSFTFTILETCSTQLNSSVFHLRSFPLHWFLHFSLHTCSSFTPYYKQTRRTKKPCPGPCLYTFPVAFSLCFLTLQNLLKENASSFFPLIPFPNAI